jgi:hypothetical protein
MRVEQHSRAQKYLKRMNYPYKKEIEDAIGLKKRPAGRRH